MPGSFVEKLYYRLPVLLQNVIFSVHGLHLTRQRCNRFFHRHLTRLKESEWWAEEAIQEYHNRKVRDVVSHAYHTVPFYRRWYDQHDVDISSIQTVEDLANLPILTKEAVRTNQRDMVSSAFTRRSLNKGLTSGTTGSPLTVYRTREVVAYQWAVWWRHKARFGLNPNDRFLQFGARVPIPQDQKAPPYWRHDVFGKRVYLSTYHISRNTVKDIVAFLNRSFFDFFTGYPSAMYVLATLMEDMGLRLWNRPKCVVAGADALLPRYEETIRRVFGAPVTEQYGMVEFAGNMSKCECGRFHVDFECCHVEEHPIDGSESSRILLTGWGNMAMPFIRYDIGDYARRSSGMCDCGRQSRCFDSIDGRLEDFIITPDGRRIIGMNQVFEYAKNAREIQLYQPAHEAVEFRIVPEEGFGQEDKDALRREFERRCGANIALSFKVVDHLERSPSGKLRAVLSDVRE